MNDKKYIYVFGDSHVMYFLGRPVKSEEADVFHTASYDELNLKIMKLGNSGATLYGLGSDNSETGANETIINSFKENDIKEVVFVIGEVDCRAHITKCENYEEIQQSIEKVFQRTENFLKQIDLSKTNVTFTYVNGPSRTFIKNSKDVNLVNWPFVVSIFNLRMKKFCLDNFYGFIDLYDRLSNCYGLINEFYLLDDNTNVHLDPNKVSKMYIDELKRIVNE